MKILIVTKQSKYEWDRKKLNLSHDSIINKYNREHANLNAILQAHVKQKEVRDLLSDIIPDAYIVMMDDVGEWAETYDLIISIGGDNLFTYTSHYINNTPILGVNSDPDRSVGHLLSYSATDKKSTHKLKSIIDNEEFDIQKWPKLEATLKGRSGQTIKITPATSEYFFGEKQRNKMSRHIILYEGHEYEQKCSGILFATGAGSSGWAKSASGYDQFSPTKNEAFIAVTEIYSTTDYGCFPRFKYFGPGEEIVLHSLNDDEGMVSVDSWEEYEFARGDEARIRIGKPLNVVIPKIGV